MFALLSFICSAVALVLGYIVSYRVMMAAAPEYASMWWLSAIFMVLMFMFGICSKLADE
jgi:hypothetical protein